MVERYNPFTDSEYVQNFIINFEREQSWKVSESEALALQAEIRMVEIQQLAYIYTVLEAIVKYCDKPKQRALVEESNTFTFARDDYFSKMHKMMQSHDGTKRSRLYQAQYDYEHPRKGGWGRYGNQTRKQIQPAVDRAAQRMINRELDLAEEEDRKSGLTV